MERSLSYPPFHPERAEIPLTMGEGEFQQEFPGENDFIEFKQGISRNQLQDTIVAFSNAGGGVILVGVADDGTVVGKPFDAGTVDSIHQVMRDVHDPGRYSLHQLLIEGRSVVVIAVARRQEGFCQSSSGVVRVRKGTRDEPLFGSDLQQLINERSARRYELTPSSISLDEANPELLGRFQEAFGWSGDALHERMAERGYAADGYLTVAGALYLAEDPAQFLGKTHVELLRYRDDESVDYDLRLEIRGPLQRQLEGSVQRVLDELGTELVVLGLRRYDLPRFHRSSSARPSPMPLPTVPTSWIARRCGFIFGRRPSQSSLRAGFRSLSPSRTSEKPLPPETSL